MNRLMQQLPFIIGLMLCSIGSAQESGKEKEKGPPFELQVILTDHGKRLDDGVSRLSKMTIEKLAKLKTAYVKSGRTDDALAVGKAIQELEAEIAAIKKRQEENRAFTSTRPKKLNDIREELTRVKWLRVGKREGIGRTLYTLKPDGIAEGFILDAQGNPGGKTAWIRWEFRANKLQIGPASGTGEVFTYDAEKGTFEGTMSELRKQEPEAERN